MRVQFDPQFRSLVEREYVSQNDLGFANCPDIRCNYGKDNFATDLNLF